MDAPMPRRARERDHQSSLDRAKVCMQQSRVEPIRKVQIVYYLSRNGQLEQPHYMEVTHLANQPLRLRDVMDRLTVLRGNGMPSLYSWSCKRSYKNGYVWNDLAENDIIYPSDGAEYVLKGSELVVRCSERFQRLSNVSNNSGQLIPEPNLHEKIRQPPNRQLEETQNNKYEIQDYDQEDMGESQEEEYEDEEKTSYTSSTTPHSRCSRGVSTEELEEEHHQPHKNAVTIVVSSSPPSTPSTLNDKPKLNHSTTAAAVKTGSNRNSTSKRFEDGDPVVAGYGTAPSRNSVLLQLISCGNLAMTKAKSNVTTTLKLPAVKMNGDRVLKKGESNSLPREVLCRTAAKVAQEEDMINYMSENPRFGNLQAQEKEYFSGSIVESITENRSVAEPALKRSNSYNEESSAKANAEEEAAKEEIRERGARGKCIPRKKSSSSSKQVRK